MDKDTHEKSIIRLRYHLEKDIKELYYLLHEDDINTFVDLEQLSVEDLNNLYIELCNMLNK